MSGTACKCVFTLSFRCVDAEAYEVKRDDVSNGIFISFLKRRVCEDEKVTVMLDRVAEGVYAYWDASRKCIFTELSGYMVQTVHENLAENCLMIP